ncbi:manganese catalase family protein [Botrimarina sp.]|uniref:manganese catalase family protein n=1 Tax=Botrimarina sp. TaxID=2795802 RepID=UPI0032EB8845
MYHHVKKLMFEVNVGEADPRFGKMLLEQFGGENGELAAAMQYSVQGMNCEDPARRDLLMDIGTEELSHLEVIGALARMHLKPLRESDEAAMADPLIALVGGGGVGLHNSQGAAWTADYVSVSGQLEVDLRNNMAAEAGAKIVYERLLKYTDDAGSRDALKFLMAREIAHLKAFGRALESMDKGPLEIGDLPADEEYVTPYYNDSTGDGDAGQDSEGPWNTADDVEVVENPAFSGMAVS